MNAAQLQSNSQSQGHINLRFEQSCGPPSLVAEHIDVCVLTTCFQQVTVNAAELSGRTPEQSWVTRHQRNATRSPCYSLRSRSEQSLL